MLISLASLGGERNLALGIAYLLGGYGSVFGTKHSHRLHNARLKHERSGIQWRGSCGLRAIGGVVYRKAHIQVCRSIFFVQLPTEVLLLCTDGHLAVGALRD